MYALSELPAGYALFKVVDADKGKFKLAAFSKFKSTKDALEAATALMEGKVAKGLKKFLKKNYVDKGLQDQLAVIDKSLASSVKKELSIPCVFGDEVVEIMRTIGHQIHDLVEQLEDSTRNQAALALAHNIARYKLKFSPDKIDLMVIQAIGLMDDLDKELNTYVMRVKEWYGWHFPEMQKIVKDNIAYAKVVITMTTRDHAPTTDLSGILDKETEDTLKEVAAVSMGSDIAKDDIDNIVFLATEAVQLQEYREQLGEYLQHRMQAIAPNLTAMVGELVGARLVSKAGSLLQLSKHPASTLQLLGAEKALFKALKAKQHTPKYGVIFQTSLIGQAPKEHKGKIARVLAAKTSLAARIDSFNESENLTGETGEAYREMVERRLHQLDSSIGYGMRSKTKGDAAGKRKSKYNKEGEQEEAAAPSGATEPLVFVKKGKKRAAEEDGEEEEPKKAKKEKKKRKSADDDE